MPKALWKEMLIVLVMAVWMAVVWRFLVRVPGGQIGYYVGSDNLRFWWEHYFIPFIGAGTFLIAPFVGACSAIRMSRAVTHGVGARIVTFLVLSFFALLFVFGLLLVREFCV